MAKPKRPRRTSWSEGDGVPDAAVVETVHVEGVTYQRRFIACGKERCRKGCASGRPSHGPYWYAFVWNPKTNTTRAVYVGKQLPRLETLADRPEMK